LQKIVTNEGIPINIKGKVGELLKNYKVYNYSFFKKTTKMYIVYLYNRKIQEERKAQESVTK
jgi:hypothetical protein